MKYGRVIGPALILGVAGCTTLPANASYIAAASPSDTSAMAFSISDFLRTEMPPAQTTLALAPEHGSDSGLVDMVAENLRLAGFAVAAPNSGAPGAQNVILDIAPLGYGYTAIIQYGNQEAGSFFNRDTQGDLALAAPFTIRETAPTANTAIAAPIQDGGIVPATYDGTLPPPPLLQAAASAAPAPIAQTLPVTAVPIPVEAAQEAISAPVGEHTGHRLGGRYWYPTTTKPLTTDDLNRMSLEAGQVQPADVIEGPAPVPAPTPVAASGPRSLISAMSSVSSSQGPLSPAINVPVVPVTPAISKGSPASVAGISQPAPPPAPLPVWTMQPGTFDGKDIVAWGASIGWKVEWNLPNDWAFPGLTPANYVGSFHDAASKALEDMANQNANLRAHFWTGNKVLVVYTPGASDAP